MVPHRPRHGCDFHRRCCPSGWLSNVLALALDAAPLAGPGYYESSRGHTPRHVRGLSSRVRSQCPRPCRGDGAGTTGVVLPQPHGDGVAAGVRDIYPTATPSPRLPRVPAHAVGGVPARGIPPLDATAGAYVTSIDTFYVQY